MSDKKLRRLPLAAAAMAVCLSAHADYTSPDGLFRLSGFGTLGVARTSTDAASFSTVNQGGGATKSASFDPDSKIALQGSYKFTPKISATAQLLTKYAPDGQYTPDVEWAFAKWQALPALSFRGGRMGAPFFMISDFRDVGYANTTIRPPRDVYGQVPVSHFDGADVAYQLNLGSTVVTSTLWAGNANSDVAATLGGTSELKLKKLVGLNIAAELPIGLTLRAGHAQGKLGYYSQSGSQLTALATGLQPLLRGYSLSPAPDAAQAAVAAPTLLAGAAIANPVDADATFSGLGLTYDQDNWIVTAEFTKRKVKAFVADTTGWYTTVGYRVGAFTPYVGLAKIKTDKFLTNPVIAASYAGSPPNPTNPLTSLTSASGIVRNGVQTLIDTQTLDQKTISLGVRWDALSSLAFKAQFDRISKPANSAGLFNVDTATAAGADFRANKRNVNVFSVAVDFVF